MKAKWKEMNDKSSDIFKQMHVWARWKHDGIAYTELALTLA